MNPSADNPITGEGFTTEYAAAAVVLGSLLMLFLLRRGFRGISAAGVSLSVK